MQLAGGTGVLEIEWQDGSTENCLNNVPAGSYEVTITDQNGCFIEATGQVSNAGGVEAEAQIISEITCNLACNGEANVNIISGSNLTYLWSNGETTNTITGLCAGTYQVTVEDDIGCSSVSSIELTEPEEISYVLETNNATCDENNGSICLSNLEGGTGDLEILWNTAATSLCIEGLTPANYSFSITDDNDCVASEAINLINEGGVTASVELFEPISCYGTCDGSLIVNATGSNLQFDWNNGENTQVIENLCQGDYQITVTDDIGCSAEAMLSLFEPLQITADFSINNATCELGNGMLCVDVENAVGGISYAWSNGATENCNNGLLPGPYDVMVTDGNGCEETFSENVTNQGGVDAHVNLMEPATCSGVCDGVVQVEVIAGNDPSFEWSNGANTSMVEDLCAGDYKVTVTDDVGCSWIGNVEVTNQTELDLTFVVENADCGQSNGSICAEIAGGSGTYTYNWSTNETTDCIQGLGPDNYQLTVEDDAGCTVSNEAIVGNNNGITAEIQLIQEISCFEACDGELQVNVNNGSGNLSYEWSNGNTTSTITNVCEGIHYVTVTDNNTSCKAISSINLEQPAQITSLANVVNATCNENNGSICMDIQNGVDPLTYTWTNGASSNCITGLSVGDYSLTVTDANNCSAIFTESILNNGGVVAEIEIIQEIKCNTVCNGSLEVNIINNGGGGLQYVWSNGETSTTIENLCAGDYEITVTDLNGCFSETSITLNEPNALLITDITVEDVYCDQNNGSACVTASGGTGALSYLWNTGAMENCIHEVSGADYQVTVTDEHECEASESIAIQNLEGLEVVVQIEDSISCAAYCNGSIESIVTGGSADLSYLWSNGSSQSTINQLCGDVYSLTVMDNTTDCQAVASVELVEPEPLLLSFTKANEACDQMNGSICANVLGGTGAMSYSWSTGEVTNCISNLTAGTYSVTISDANSCGLNAATTIQHVGGVEAVLNETSPIVCAGSCSGVLEVNASTGGNTLNYNWSNGFDQAIQENICPGTYQVTISDNNGCETEVSIQVEEPLPFVVESISEESSCDVGDGSICIEADGGVGPYNYMWGNAFDYACQENLSIGNYSITVTDALGCSIVIEESVSGPQQPQVELITSEKEGCAPFNFMLDIEADPAILNDLTILWNIGSTNNLILNDDLTYTIENPGEYAVSTIIEYRGCDYSYTSEDSIHVLETPNSDFDFFAIEEGAFSYNIYALEPREENELDSWVVAGELVFSEPMLKHYSFDDVGVYEICLTRKNDDGCVSKTCDLIDVKLPYFAAYIPNTFTPNNDAKNEIFKPVLTSYNVTEYEFRIFNRWGDVIYFTDDPYAGWDGTYGNKDAVQDVYSWKLILRNLETKKLFEDQGRVTLLR